MDHISSLVKLIFLNSRPAPPAQSRWTGVPNVARWCYGLFAFHGLFSRLVSSLSPNSDAAGGGRGRGGRGARARGRGRQPDAPPQAVPADGAGLDADAIS